MIRTNSTNARQTMWRFTAMLMLAFGLVGCVSGGDDGEIGDDIGVVVEKITIDPASVSLTIDEVVQFNATIHYSNNTTESGQAANSQVTWSVADDSVAKLSSNPNRRGSVAAVAEGETTITASFEGNSVSANIVVAAPRLLAIEVSPENLQLFNGFQFQYRATGIFDDNSTQDLTDTVSWSSAPNSVVEINNTNDKGLASARQDGDATITATIEADGDTFAQSVSVNVVTATLAGIEVGLESGSNCNLGDLPVGSQCQLVATGRFTLSGGGETSRDITESVDWSSSCSNSITVSAEAGSRGLIESVAETTGELCGDAIVTITATEQGGSVSGSIEATAKPLRAVRLVRIERDRTTLPVGLSERYRVFGERTDGRVTEVNELVSWESAKPEFATVTDGGPNPGTVEAVAESGGETFAITASIDGSECSTTCELSVNLEVVEAVIETITVTPAHTNLPKGLTLAFTANVEYSDGTTAELTTGVKWCTRRTSDGPKTCENNPDANVLEIDNSTGNKGKLKSTTNKNVGQTTVIVAQGPVDDEGEFVEGVATVTLTAATVTELVVSPADAEIEVDGTQQYRVIAEFSDGTERDVTAEEDTVWSSTDSSLVTISNSLAANTKGLATGRSVGNTAKIRASFGDKTSETGVTIIESTLLQAFSLHSVTNGITFNCDTRDDEQVASPSDPYFVPVGYCRQFYVCGLYSDGRNERISNSQIDWYMFDDVAASIDSAGCAEGEQTGEDRVVAQVTANHQDGSSFKGESARIDVVNVSLTGLAVSPEELTLEVGESSQVIVTGTFGAEGTLDLTKQVGWEDAKSGEDTIATVSNTSLVTGAQVGTGTATASAEDHTASVDVTVE